MISGIEAILLFSENTRRLAEFYRDIVGLEITTEFEIGDKAEVGFVFDMKGCNLYITPHSEVKGKNINPERIMFNLEVSNIEEGVKELKKKKAKLIQDTYHVENFGFIATFEDPDGNYFQLVKTRE